MFRRKEDEEIASQPQDNNNTSNSAVSQSAFPPIASAKPAAPSFGSFGATTNSAPVSSNNSDSAEKKPVTAPLTTQQVGLGAQGSSAISPQNNASAIKANPSAAPGYNKIPTPTATPAAIPTAAPYQSNNSKLEGIEAERRLTVGYGITLTGEVSDCDRLVIYGKVNAKLQNVKFLQISDSGKFNGSAAIDQAEISGIFEGELKVANNITITSTGRVNGKITYGSIEIRPGGKFTGEIIEDASAATAAGQSYSSEGKKDQYNLNSNNSAGKSEAA